MFLTLYVPDSAECSTQLTIDVQKRSREALSLCETQNLHTVLLQWMLVQLEVLVVWYEFQVRSSLDSLASVPIVHFLVTSHCTQKIVPARLHAGSASAERMGQGVTRYLAQRKSA